MNYAQITYSLQDAERGLDAAQKRAVPCFFQWLNCFGSKSIHTVREADDLSQYDVVHLHLASLTYDLARQVRGRIGWNADTKIVVSVDYGLELWRHWLGNPEQLLDNLSYADIITAPEPVAAELLADLTGREVLLTTNPAPIKKLSRSKSEKRDGISVTTHRYDKNAYLPYWVTRDYKPSHLFGHTDGDKREGLGRTDNTTLMYDRVHPMYAHEEYMSNLSRRYVNFDSYTVHSPGRTQIECAAVGVPCIGYETSWAQTVLFPALTFRVNDLNGVRKAMRMLHEDEAFYYDVMHYAFEKLDFFDIPACGQRLKAALKGPEENDDSGLELCEEDEGARSVAGSAVDGEEATLADLSPTEQAQST